MTMRFFNTYSRKIEEFEARDSAGHAVSIYTCGPTVYSRAHIGNFRAYIFEDLLQRHLELRGYKVHRVMNITDVDDKTIRGAREAGIPLGKFTAQFKEAFFEDSEMLRIKRADEFPAATEQQYIDRMIEMIGTLISRGLAYQADDRSVYFRIHKFPNYGKLAHFDLTQLQSTGRVKHDEYDKEHIGDFALWKAWDEEDGDVNWDSPWGPGRPGWHIECSAMATALHCAHLLVDGQKMSKSLGNFYTIPDVLAKGYTGREIRYALMRVNYRDPLNFTWNGMQEARESLERIDEWLDRLRECAGDKIDSGRIDSHFGHEFEDALDNDLNISAALGFLFESISESNRAMDENKLDAKTAAAWLNWWERINRVLRFEPGEARVRVLVAQTGELRLTGTLVAKKIPAEVARLAKERAQARLAKDFRKSDELRDKLNALGWEARDTKDGQKITRRAGA